MSSRFQSKNLTGGNESAEQTFIPFLRSSKMTQTFSLPLLFSFRSFTIQLMNIGITVYPTYGGSGIVGSELGRELAARGHNVHFISSMLPTRLTELGERVHFHEVEMMSYPLFEH